MNTWVHQNFFTWKKNTWKTLYECLCATKLHYHSLRINDKSWKAFVSGFAETWIYMVISTEQPSNLSNSLQLPLPLLLLLHASFFLHSTKQKLQPSTLQNFHFHASPNLSPPPPPPSSKHLRLPLTHLPTKVISLFS